MPTVFALRVTKAAEGDVTTNLKPNVAARLGPAMGDHTEVRLGDKMCPSVRRHRHDSTDCFKDQRKLVWVDRLAEEAVDFQKGTSDNLAG